MTMDYKNRQLTAEEIMQRCKSITLTDDQGQKHGMMIWATFNGNPVSDTEYHKVLDGLFDMVKRDLLDIDISVNYRFCSNSIIAIGGESRWFESHGIMELQKDDKWMELLIDMELADLPETSSFPEFMEKLEELEKSDEVVNYLYPISMTLCKKPGDDERTESDYNQIDGELGEAMKGVRGAVTGVNNQYQED